MSKKSTLLEAVEYFNNTVEMLRTDPSIVPKFVAWAAIIDKYRDELGDRSADFNSIVKEMCEIAFRKQS